MYCCRQNSSCEIYEKFLKPLVLYIYFLLSRRLVRMNKVELFYLFFNQFAMQSWEEWEEEEEIFEEDYYSSKRRNRFFKVKTIIKEEEGTSREERQRRRKGNE